MRKAGECVHKQNELRDVVKKKIASQWFNGKESSANAGDVGLISGWVDPLEEEMATHSSILAWKIPLTERGAWQTTVHEVAESWTRRLSTQHEDEG